MDGRGGKEKTDAVLPKNLSALAAKLDDTEQRYCVYEKRILDTALITPATAIHTGLQFLVKNLLFDTNRFCIDIRLCNEIFQQIVRKKIAIVHTETQRAKTVASRAATLLLRINWLYHIYQEYFIARHAIEEKHLKQLLGDSYNIYSIIQKQHLKITCEFLTRYYSEYAHSHIQVLPQADLYVFFALRDIQISMMTADDRITLDISAVRFKIQLLERMVKVTQTPVIACRAILFLATTLFKILSHETSYKNFDTPSLQQMITHYQKNLVLVEGNDLPSRGLRHIESLLVAYVHSLSHLQRYTKLDTRKHKKTKESDNLSNPISRLDKPSADEVTERLMAEYGKIDEVQSTTLITECLAVAEPIDLRDAHIGMASSHLFIIWIMIKFHLMMMTDMLDCLEVTFTHFKHHQELSSLSKAWESGSDLSKHIMQHDLFGIVTSVEWQRYHANVNYYLFLHDRTQIFANSNDQANRFAAKFQPKNTIPTFECREKKSIVDKIKRCLDQIQKATTELKVKKEKKGLAFYRSLLTQEASRKKMSSSLFKQSELRTRDRKLNTDTESSSSTKNENTITSNQKQESATVDQAAQALMLGDIQRAIYLFTTSLEADIFAKETAQNQIKCAWGLGECYQALAKKTMLQTDKQQHRNKARYYFENAIALINNAMRLFPEDVAAVTHQQLITDRSYLVYILETEFRKTEKRELSYIKAGLQYGLSHFPSVSVTLPSSTRTTLTTQSQNNPPTEKPRKVSVKTSLLEFGTTPQLKLFFDTLINQKVDFFIYGGAVRDKLLDLPLRDIDLCTHLNLENIETLLKENGYYFEKIGITWPLLQVSLGHITVEISSQPQKQPTYASVTHHHSIHSPDHFENCDATINAFRFYPASNELVYLNESDIDLNDKRIGFFTSQSCNARLTADPSLYFRFISLAAKLHSCGFQFDPLLAAAMPSYSLLQPTLDERNKRRCFVQFCRPFTQGYAVTAWHLLEQMHVLHPRTPSDSAFIKSICHHLDETFAQRKPPSLALLISALLLEPFKEKIDSLLQTNLIDANSISTLLDNLLTQCEIGIPNPSIAQSVKNTLSLWAIKQTSLSRSLKLDDTLSYADFLRVEELLSAQKTVHEQAEYHCISSISLKK